MKIVSKLIQAVVFLIAVLYIYTTDISEGKLKDTNVINEVNYIIEKDTNEENPDINANEIFLGKEVQKNLEEKASNNVKIQKEDKVLGTIIIDKINFKGTIYEGVSQDILSKGVGHFEHSPYLNGNVCLAAHNTKDFWAELKILEEGDKIIYESFLGTKNYTVFEKNQINENDWIRLEDTHENILTLITCVKGQREKRLCVQAKELV